MAKLKKNKLLSFIAMSLKGVVTVALLYWVVHSVELNNKQGWQEFIDSVLSANICILIVSVAFVPLMDMVSTLKWHMLVKFKHAGIGFWKLFAFYVVGKFFNMILPSSVGGDLIRIHLLGKETGNLASSAGIVFFERVTGLMLLVLLAAIALFMATGVVSEPWIKWLVLGAGLGLTGIISGFMFDKSYNLICKFFEERHPFFKKIFCKIHKIRNTIIHIGSNRKALFMAFFNSALFYVAAILNAWVSVLVFDKSISIVTMIVAVPIIMFVMNLPVSIGNVGIMEFSYTAILSAFGVDPAIALSVAVLARFKYLIEAGIGGVIYQFISLRISNPVRLKQELRRAYGGKIG